MILNCSRDRKRDRMERLVGWNASWHGMPHLNFPLNLSANCKHQLSQHILDIWPQSMVYYMGDERSKSICHMIVKIVYPIAISTL